MGVYIRMAPLAVVLAAAGVTLLSVTLLAGDNAKPTTLPAPQTKGAMSVEEALAKRRSIRNFKAGPLGREQIAQLCWAAQGISAPRRRLRTCPSAGALYPLELYVVTAEGVYHYQPKEHRLVDHLPRDIRSDLAGAALHQSSVGDAPVTLVIAAVPSRTQRKYGRRAMRYVWTEVGHAGQNILLQATAMGLGAAPVGAFDDDNVARLLKLPENCRPAYLIPVGTPDRPQ